MRGCDVMTCFCAAAMIPFLLMTFWEWIGGLVPMIGLGRTGSYDYVESKVMNGS